jgi:alpha-tubulin suppressor-like RCC1 family protein
MSGRSQLACGWNHSILVGDDGKFYGWGMGASGELGPEKGFVKFKPMELKLANSIKPKEGGQVAVGAQHTLILSADGDVYSMGSNEYGRLGHDQRGHGFVNFPRQREAKATTQISTVACGTEFSVAISKDAKHVYAWGLGKYGNIGDGHRLDRPSPVTFQIVDPRTLMAKKVTQISCGSRHTLALCEDGHVFSWGYGQNGRLGHGDITDCLKPRRIDAFVLSDEQRMVEIAAGDSHSMARNKFGVYTWGSGSYGRLGLGTEHDQFVPKMIDALKQVDVTRIACNAFHSLAVIDAVAGQSTLYTWGGGKYGKLGHSNASQQNSLIPREVPFFRRRGKNSKTVVIQASCGLHFTIAVTDSNRVYGWGYTADYRCGTENLKDSTWCATPMRLTELDSWPIVNRTGQERNRKTTEFVETPMGNRVAAGNSHSMALAENGTLFTWGENKYGQLGTGYHQQTYKPIAVFFGPKAKVRRIACGGNHSLAIVDVGQAKGSVYGWGQNLHGQLGLGATTNDIENFPVLVKALQGTRIDEITAGYSHSAAVTNLTYDELQDEKSRAKVYLWGSNEHGQLGIGSNKTFAQTTPQSIRIYEENYHSFQVALGANHTLVLGSRFIARSGDSKSMSASSKRLKGPFEKNYINQLEKTRLYACGRNDRGQIGTTTHTTDSSFSTNVYSLVLVDTFPIDTDIDARGMRDADGHPMIKTVCAGDHTSVAVTADPDFEDMYAWGETPGLEPATRFEAAPVDEFSRLSLAEKLDNIGTVRSLHFDRISIARFHSLAVMNVNNERKAVFAWGESKYGKLGVGNIAALQSKLLAAVRKNQGDEKAAVIPSSWPPQPIPMLSSANDISDVSCSGDHSLATSNKSGVVYAWGYGNKGRLGLGDDEETRDRSQVQPIELAFFKRARADEDLLIDSDEEEEDRGGDDDDDMEDFMDNRANVNAEDMLHDPVLEQLAPHNMPKERFEKIAHLQEQIAAKEAELRRKLERYLRLTDDLEHRRDIVNSAVDVRIGQMSMRERIGHKSKDAIVAKRIADSGDDVVTVQPLNEIEKVCSRMYMAPCLMVDLYRLIKEHIDHEELHYEESYDAMITDFVEILFAVYDLHLERNRKLLEVVLLTIFRDHVRTAVSSEDILAPDSLEWAVFLECMRRGKVRRKVQRVLDIPLSEIEYPDEENLQDPTEVIKYTEFAVAEGKVSESISQLVQMSAELLGDITNKSVSPIMDTVGWLVEILDDAFVYNGRREENIVGLRTIRAVVTVNMADQDNRRERLSNDYERRKTLYGNEDIVNFDYRSTISPMAEAFLFHMLSGVDDAIDFINRLSHGRVKPHSIPGDLHHFFDDKEEQLQVFRKTIRAARRKALKGKDYDEDVIEKLDWFDRERDLLKEFLIMRTVRERRTISISRAACRLLIAMEMVRIRDGDLIEQLTGADASDNIRIDTFYTDRARENIVCSRCRMLHPKMQYTLDYGDDKEEYLDEPQIDEHMIRKAIMFSIKECSFLWHTLKERPFQVIRQTQVGEGAWKAIMEKLKEMRQLAAERKNNDAAERYEECSRMLRRIKEAKPGHALFLGRDKKPAIQEMKDPSRLIDRVREVDQRSERNEIVAYRNALLMVDLVAELTRRENALAIEVDNMGKAFADLTQRVGNPKMWDFRKNAWNAKSRGFLTEWNEVRVHKERGSVRSFGWQDLYRADVLAKDPTPGNHVNKILCFPITWFKWMRAKQRTKNQILFFEKVQFTFITTENDDIFELKIVFEGQLLVAVLLSLAVLEDRQETEQETLRQLAFDKGVKPQCHIIEYTPHGDRVPINVTQTFVFDQFNLHDMLNALPRVHPQASGGNQINERADVVIDAVRIAE